MCSQTIHYATKGEITGMIAACNGNFINPGRAVFAQEHCGNLIWRASQYFQNMLYRLKEISVYKSGKLSILAHRKIS